MFIHRTLLNTTIATLLALGSIVARADISTDGHLDQRVVAGNGDSDDRFSECITCSAGFMGREGLGNGLKAIFRLDIGQVHVGTISTVYTSHGAGPAPYNPASQRDRFPDLQTSQHRGAGPGKNTTRYDSPVWKGLKFGAAYTLVPDIEGNDSGYGAGISYENGGILMFADYITSDTRDEDNAWNLGGKYTVNNFSLMARYERDDGLIGGKGSGMFGEDAGIWHLGGSYTMGNSMLYFGYDNDFSGSDGVEDDRFSVGMKHRF